MGNFRIEIEAVGGHGCDRDAKEGETFYGCGKMGCPDCELRRFLSQLARSNSVDVARLVHWPGSTSEVVDEYRRGAAGTHFDSKRVKGHF